MPKKWSEVETDPNYQALPPDKQEAAKQQYFDAVVAPRVPKESLPVAKVQFFHDAGTSATPVQEFAKQKSPGSAESSVLEGATFGFGDELMGGLAAADTGISNLFDHVQGKKPKFSPGEAYSAVRDQTRLNASSAKFQTDYPKGNQTGLEFMGGLMTGGEAGAGAIKDATTIAGRVGRSTLTGMGMGGIAGFGSGEDGFVNRAKGAGKGMIAGGAMGAIPGVAAELTGPARRGAGYAAKAFRSVFQSISGKSPEDAMKSMRPEELKKYQDMAVDYVKNLIKESGGKIENLSDDAAHVQGKPVTSAEAIGRQGSNQLASIGRRGGETGDVAESQFRQRSQERPERLKENLSKAARISTQEVDHVATHVQGMADDLRVKNNPRYAEAFSQKAPDIEHDKEFQNIANQDNFQEALNIAKKAHSNKQEAIPIFKGDDGKWYGKPSWEQLDTIKKAMDSVISRKHTNGVGKFVTDFQSRDDLEGANNYRGWLFKGNPKYEEAVAHGGEPIKMEKAFSSAAKIMSPGTSEREFHKALNDMTPAELTAFKSGWVHSVYEGLQKSGGKGALRPKDLTTPEFMSKAERLLGKSQAKQFVSEVQQEMRLQANEQRIPPGRQSITGELKHAGEEMDQKTDDMIHGFIDNAIRRGVPTAILRAANNLLFDVFRAAKTPEKRALRDEVGKLLLMKPNELRAKLEAKDGLSQHARDIGTMIQHLMTSGAQKSVAPVATTSAMETAQ